MQYLVILILAVAAMLPAAAQAGSVSVRFGDHAHGHRGQRDYHRAYWPRRHYHRPYVRYTTVYSVAPPPVVETRMVYVAAAAPPSPAGYCREYQAAAIVGGLPQPAYGTACLQPDGSWKIVD